ncbi:MAG: hypothetical protein CSA26_09250 [Desulfobacterales bacterium]|nr:MAG: hypothetical protein CSA26_09250 [Desulfobacterales bacterium]
MRCIAIGDIHMTADNISRRDKVHQADLILINDFLEGIGINLHNQVRLFQNRVCLKGVGDSNRPPCATPSEFSESELAEFAENGYDQAMNYINPAEPIKKIKIPLIMISHTPPLKTAVDRLSNGSHVGSKAIRRFIEKRQPVLCISGYIHEAKGTDTIGHTTTYNPVMFNQRGWLEIFIETSEIKTVLHD